MQNLILFKFFKWHFGTASLGILRAWGNFLVFNLEHFSIGGLLTSLFSHWRKDKASYGAGFSPSVWVSAFLSNITTRVLGAIARTVVICIGLVVEIMILIVGLAVFLIWFFLPVILLAIFFYIVGVLT